MAAITATSGTLSGNDTLTLTGVSPKTLSFGFSNTSSSATTVTVIANPTGSAVTVGSVIANTGMQPLKNDSGVNVFKITAPDDLQSYAVFINDPSQRL